MTRDEHSGLMSEQYIAVYPSLAKRCGINKAAILQRLHWKIESVKSANYQEKHFKGADGVTRWWFRASYTDWQARQFPWLSRGTVQRLFLELEADGILVVWTPEDNNQDKYYSIRYEAWEYWMKGHAVKPITKCGWWPVLDLSQNEVGPITICGGGDHNLWLAPITKCDGSLIYKDSEQFLNKNQQSSSTPTPVPDSLIPDVEDDEENSTSGDDVTSPLLTQLFESLGMAADIQTRMTALGAAHALALVWMAQENTNKPSPVGLLLTMIDRQQQPPDVLIHLAELALEIGTTDRDTAEREQRARSIDVQEADDAPTPLPITPPATPATSDGLDDRPHRGAKTIREIWGDLQLAAAKYCDSATREVITVAQPVSLTDNVLTIRAPNPAALDAHSAMLARIASSLTHRHVRQIRIESAGQVA